MDRADQKTFREDRMITNGQMEAALNYLAESEQEWSELRASKDLESKRLEITLASGIIDSNSSTQAGKKVDALDSKDYKETVEQYQQLLEAFYLVDAKRKRAEITIDTWRTLEASRRRGTIT